MVYKYEYTVFYLFKRSQRIGTSYNTYVKSKVFKGNEESFYSSMPWAELFPTGGEACAKECILYKVYMIQ